MRVLVFGITGMLGHVAWLSFRKELEVYGTVRMSKKELIERRPLFRDGSENILGGVDALCTDAVNRVIEKISPDIIINCIGVIKQLKEADDPVLSISVNSLFPNIIAKMCKGRNIKLVHISTDCVFSGEKGLYTELDNPDARDLYGRTKYMGEVGGANCLTIRTSLIGRELRGRGMKSLLEWFLAQEGEVKGYKRAIFSGLTTYAFSEILKEIIIKYPALSGIYHIASHPISKYELLIGLRDAYGKVVNIVPDERITVNRSLDPSKFKREASIEIPAWNEMFEDLKKERSINDF